MSAYAVVSFPFADVSEDAWYYGNAAYAYVNGLFSGTSGTSFSPDGAMTRAMLAQVLYRMAGTPAVTEKAAFIDVASDAWYSSAVNWVMANGVVTGTDETHFSPDSNVTREQAAAMLCRYAKRSGKTVAGSSDLSAFSDAAQISGWAKDAVAWAVAGKILKGSAGALAPSAAASRAQMAALLQRYQALEKAA